MRLTQHCPWAHIRCPIRTVKKKQSQNKCQYLPLLWSTHQLLTSFSHDDLKVLLMVGHWLKLNTRRCLLSFLVWRVLLFQAHFKLDISSMPKCPSLHAQAAHKGLLLAIPKAKTGAVKFLLSMQASFIKANSQHRLSMRTYCRKDSSSLPFFLVLLPMVTKNRHPCSLYHYRWPRQKHKQYNPTMKVLNARYQLET